MCSSDFISQSWATLLYGFNKSINNYQKLHRPLLSKHLQILAWLCDEARILIDHWTFLFNNKVTLNAALFTRSFFESNVINTINNIQIQAPAHFQIIIPSVIEIFGGSLLPSPFNTDWTIEYGNESNGYLTQSVPRLYMNDTCNCVVSSFCQDYLRIGPSDLILPGLVIGCSPIQGLRMSTLECFYSSDCISTIINHFEYYTQTDGSPPTDFVPPTIPPIAVRPLDSSIQSRFLSNSSIESLINAMFIEDWIATASYERYFTACKPSECRYQYTKRQSIIYVALSLLALYGGLTVGWRFIVWNSLLLYHWIKGWHLKRHTTVQPLSVLSLPAECDKVPNHI